jgi:tetratricopeptide (TPR) repeat protein
MRWVAIALFVVASSASAAPASLWDDVAQPEGHRCAALLDEANHLLSSNQPRVAIQTLRALVKVCSADREAHQLLGETLVAQREYPAARIALERAREISLTEEAAGPSDARGAREVSLAFHLGFVREVTGDLEGALREHRRLEALGGLGSNEYLVHYDLGDELMALGRLDEAIDEYRRAVRLAPEKPMARLALAVALDRNQQGDKSRIELLVALSLDPQLRCLFADEYVFVPAADVHYYLALGFLGRGLRAQARAALRQFIELEAVGQYLNRARQHLSEIERSIDPAELELSNPGLDGAALARAIGPLLPNLESCVPGPLTTKVKLTVVRSGLRAADDPGACLNAALATLRLAGLRDGGSIVVPLAGRREVGASSK